MDAEDRRGGRVSSSVCGSVPNNALSRGERAPSPFCSICVGVDFCAVNTPTTADLKLPTISLFAVQKS